MLVQSLPTGIPHRSLLKLGIASMVLVLMHAVPVLAATATNLPPALVIATNAAPAPAAVPKANDGDDDQSFNLNINTKNDGKSEGLTAQIVDDLIPLAGIAASFGTPILIVFFVCYFSYRRRRENVALARDYLAKGLPVPPELLDPAQKALQYARSKQGAGSLNPDIRRGFRLTFIGLAVTAALFVHNTHSTTWGWGLVPTIMGIGFLLSGWFENCGDDKNPPDRPAPPGDPL